MVSCAVSLFTQGRRCFGRLMELFQERALKSGNLLNINAPLSPLPLVPNAKPFRCSPGRKAGNESQCVLISASLHSFNLLLVSLGLCLWTKLERCFSWGGSSLCACVCPAAPKVLLSPCPVRNLLSSFLVRLRSPSQQALSPRAMLGTESTMTLNFRDQQAFGIGLGESLSRS